MGLYFFNSILSNLTILLGLGTIGPALVFPVLKRLAHQQQFFPDVAKNVIFTDQIRQSMLCKSQFGANRVFEFLRAQPDTPPGQIPVIDTLFRIADRQVFEHV
jgi:hypothetical protein